ncbi:MAG: hypothetical protein A3H69_03615 [Candidatus Sungbacteria bacterium RIFCSPLOWO2_02_FULL_47_9]|uniref:Transposase IS200-like domain-containing protein n=1 Tax=Candidatus Sungbacteria bacterium RIFCSPHIGHO2_01_FULL_47_32 TaxID=1802264 RepID=A0A1G2KBM2_9BACT|nr:MAG: hypothetical protein A2633_02450 [Candidatus Sungbacteria bacterium RIFCSPHIGHO2_01_FULL_47_32]OGZ98886.1 MAG: hypothetical protein A3D57_01830 [Candidatus Sungbacteria bacterium RIFCSPHIGHO2_02_FULL_46_12]OHA06181.1 MAG: hypothetical protein A3A28_01055 [Candidatus Sungbacteria bacterium RIFCSPLOWO2_01_FULL_47_32]OHA12089.1 MAG: hypothetical protein A3H69_03615 [Candidatus Sungbacteria bacterium RIFCSPLOWO2_02_FULL_47_9]
MATYQNDYHHVYLCDYHIVISTKYRRKIINDGIFAYLKRKLLEITEHYSKLFIKEANLPRIEKWKFLLLNNKIF